jgi:hypothetical protein
MPERVGAEIKYCRKLAIANAMLAGKFRHTHTRKSFRKLLEKFSSSLLISDAQQPLHAVTGVVFFFVSIGVLAESVLRIRREAGEQNFHLYVCFVLSVLALVSKDGCDYEFLLFRIQRRNY